MGLDSYYAEAPYLRTFIAMHRHHNQPSTAEVKFGPLVHGADLDFQRWKSQKFEKTNTNADDLLVEIKDPLNLTSNEEKQLRQVVSQNNFVIYQYQPGKDYSVSGYQHLCNRLGLTNTISNLAANDDDVSLIQVSGKIHDKEYVPYTNQALKWHTDGYYNEPDQLVQSFVLHCIHAAHQGGANSFMDHEIAYLLLHERNPDWVEALSASDVMTIPANTQGRKILRAAFQGPVFDTSITDARVYMRFTERKRNILWKQQDDVLQAIVALGEILNQPNPWKIDITLEPGQGVICNNVLHRREAFQDDNNSGNRRCFHRIRYQDRVDR